MDFTVYLFAFYVFLLVCALIWLYARLTRSGKKQDKGGAYDKEQRLFQMYQNIEDMLGGFEEYAEEAKAGIDARLKQAEALMEKLKAGDAAPVAMPESAPPQKDEIADESIASGKAQKPVASSQEKSKRKTEEMIQKYLAKGMSIEEAAKALGISTKEVSLIMQLKK